DDSQGSGRRGRGGDDSQGSGRRGRGGDDSQGSGRRGRGGDDSQGGGGGWRGRGGRRPGAGASMAFLSNDKLDCDAMGKVIAIEEKDGVSMAKVEINATISGKGDAEALGMSGAGQGGRRGGFGGGDMETKAALNVSMQGVAWVNLQSHMVTALNLTGTMQQEREMFGTMGRGGEDRDIEVNTSTNGKFSIDVTCQPQ
ncbi:MAG: hypothetical protein AAF628_22650, partial [Planctomycetota bacterium]